MRSIIKYIISKDVVLLQPDLFFVFLSLYTFPLRLDCNNEFRRAQAGSSVKMRRLDLVQLAVKNRC